MTISFNYTSPYATAYNEYNTFPNRVNEFPNIARDTHYYLCLHLTQLINNGSLTFDMKNVQLFNDNCYSLPLNTIGQGYELIANAGLFYKEIYSSQSRYFIGINLFSIERLRDIIAVELERAGAISFTKPVDGLTPAQMCMLEGYRPNKSSFKWLLTQIQAKDPEYYAQMHGKLENWDIECFNERLRTARNLNQICDLLTPINEPNEESRQILAAVAERFPNLETFEADFASVKIRFFAALKRWGAGYPDEKLLSATLSLFPHYELSNWLVPHDIFDCISSLYPEGTFPDSIPVPIKRALTPFFPVIDPSKIDKEDHLWSILFMCFHAKDYQNQKELYSALPSELKSRVQSQFPEFYNKFLIQGKNYESIT